MKTVHPLLPILSINWELMNKQESQSEKTIIHTTNLKMAALKSQSAFVLLLLVVSLGTKTKIAEAQTNGGCTNLLTNLNTCAPFVLPGASNTNPSPDCCGALKAVDKDCLCNTISIASQLPSQCQLPPLACLRN